MQATHEGTAVSGQGVSGVKKLFSNNVCPMDLKLSDNKAPWSLVYFGGTHLNGIDVFRDEGVGSRNVVHNVSHIEASPTDDYIIAIPLSTRSHVAQAGSLSVIEPGSFLLTSTAEPFSAWVSSAGTQGNFSQLLAKVPGDMLRERLPHVQGSINKPINIQSGAGRIMKSMIELALAEGGSLTDKGAMHFGAMLTEAIANATTESALLNLAQRRQSPLARIREVANEFVERNLSNPLLDVALIAAHCEVSPRYLHAAFAEASIRIGAYIREQRLLRCQADLQSRGHEHKPVIEIALKWGFEDPAHFSRLYKSRFGYPPSKRR